MFDLDNTLYPADCNLFAEIDTRMGDFIAARFGVSLEEAQRMRKSYYYQYGTTLAGLMRLHDVCPNAFLDYVHDIDLSVIAPAPELRPSPRRAAGAQIRLHQRLAQPRRGGDRAAWARRRFDGCVRHPCRDSSLRSRSARLMSASCGRTACRGASAAMFDDLPHNLDTAHRLGMTTVLVPRARPIIPSITPSPAGASFPRTSITAPTRSRPSSPKSARAGADEASRSPIALAAQFCLT